MRVAELAQPAQVALGRQVDAAFALHRLDDERRGLVVDRALGGDEVAEGHEHGLGQQRAVRVAVLGLADHRERAERAAVERALGGDELAPAGGAVRELERALDRLGAGVREEAARDGLGREPRQRLGQLELGQRVEQVRGLHQPAGLLADRVHQRGVAVPDRAAAPAGGEVHVLAAVHVHDARAAPLDQRDRQPVHDGQEPGGLAALDVVDPHLFPSFDLREVWESRGFDSRRQASRSHPPTACLVAARGIQRLRVTLGRVTDVILLEGIQILAALGVTAAERRSRRPVLLDVEVERDLRAAGRSDRIGQTIHYKRIYEVVEDVAANQQHKLVEALGHRIAEAILGKFDADAVTVTVRKPKPIAGVLEHAGVRIRRERDAR